MVKQRSDKKWYLTYHPVTNTNKPENVRGLLIGVAKFQCTSFDKPLLTGPDFLQNLIHVPLRFRQNQVAAPAVIDVTVAEFDQPSPRFFVVREAHNKCCSVSIHAPFI